MNNIRSIILAGRTTLHELRRKGSTTVIMNLVKKLPKAIIFTGNREQYIDIMREHGLNHRSYKNVTVSINPLDYSDIHGPVIIDTSYVLTLLDSASREVTDLIKEQQFKDHLLNIHQDNKNRLGNTFKKLYSYYPRTWWSKTEKMKIETEDPIDAAIRFIEENRQITREDAEKKFRKLYRTNALKYGRVKTRLK